MPEIWLFDFSKKLYAHQHRIFFYSFQVFCNSMFCHQTSKKTKRSGIKPLRNANQMTFRCCFAKSEGCLLRQDVNFPNKTLLNQFHISFISTKLFQLAPDNGIGGPIFSLEKTCCTNTTSHLLKNVYQCCWVYGKLKPLRYSEAKVTSLLLN